MSLNIRKERGLSIAKKCKIAERGDHYIVPSQNSNKNYIVRLGKNAYCNCPDFATRGDMIGKCKHIFAVEIKYTEQKDHFGNTVKTQTTRITYSQNWSSYNKAQTTEKEQFMKLLQDACNSIEQPKYSFGRPTIPISDMIFCMAFKTYSMFSGRRFVSDMKFAKEKRYIENIPHYNSVFNYFNKPELTKILYNLIELTSLPLRSIEKDFAVDSSGFSTSVYSRWFDKKYGRNKEEKIWLKAHISVGVKTNVVTAIKITDGTSSDGKEFTNLIEKTSKNFKMKEISADKAYSSRENLQAVENIGAEAFIPFRKKSRARRGGSIIWKKMWHYYNFNQEDFMNHYHKRSNVETTFSMIKKKFGTNVKSKNKVAQINEILCKILCHNICVVLQECN